MILLCLCYKLLLPKHVVEKEETLKLMDGTYRKIVLANMKLNYNYKVLPQNIFNNTNNFKSRP